MEQASNISSISNEVAEKMRAATQAAMPSLPELVGRYVKKRFAEGNNGEHMWVEVASVNEETGTLLGFLDNEPVKVRDVCYGDEVVVYREEIEEIM